MLTKVCPALGGCPSLPVPLAPELLEDGLDPLLLSLHTRSSVTPHQLPNAAQHSAQVLCLLQTGPSQRHLFNTELSTLLPKVPHCTK